MGISGGFRKIDIPATALGGDIDPGPAPVLQWVKIRELVIDERYQRDLKRANWTAIRKIAKNFKWSRFGPVFVAPVEGGKYAVIDGQHRAHAAALLGIEAVPAQLVHMTTEEQAASFAAINGAVTAVTVFQVFKAALIAKEAWATALDEMARAANCRVMTYNVSAHLKKSGQIFAIRDMQSLAAQYKRDDIVLSLKLLRTSESYHDDPDIWTSALLRPLIGAFCQRPHTIRRQDFLSSFDEFDVYELQDAVDEKAKSARQQGDPPISRREEMETGILSWMDETMPVRVAAPVLSRSCA